MPGNRALSEGERIVTETQVRNLDHCYTLVVVTVSVSHTDRLEPKIIKYLNIVCEYEIVGVDGKERALSSAISVLNILLTTQTLNKVTHLYKGRKLCLF